MKRAERAGLYLALGLGSAVFLMPFLWMLSSSLKTAEGVAEFPPRLVPRSDFVRVGGAWREVRRVRTEYGAVLVRILEGERAGEVAEVRSSAVAGGILDEPSRGRPVRVEVVRTTSPDRHLVRLVSPAPGEPEELWATGGEIAKRVRLRFGNYAEAFSKLDFLRYVFNTLLVTALCVVGQVLSGSLAGYGFARYDFPGRRALFLVLLATMMLPFQVTMIPVFLLFKTFGWIDTYAPLVAPAFFGTPFFIFLFRQFFMSMPTDIEDAARMDGCSELGIYWRIILPVSRPAVATVAVFTFIGTWNDFLGPLIYLNSMEKFTISLALNMFKGEFGIRDAHLLMALSSLVMVPCLVLFFAAQKHFARSIIISK